MEWDATASDAELLHYARGKIFPTGVRVDLDTAVRLAAEMGGRGCKAEENSRQVDQGANQVELRSGQIDKAQARQIRERAR